MRSPPPQLTLYVKPGCHLCEEAREVLAMTGLYPQVIERDISRDSALQDAYGMRIPVLARADTGEELSWPFGLPDVRQFVSRDE